MKENIEILFEKLKDFIRTETVVGQAIHIDDTIIVPFVTVSFGAGTGATNNTVKNEGSAGGAGAKISPDAVLVIKGERVSLLPIKSTTSVERLIDMVPGILSKVSQKVMKKDDHQQDQDEKKRDLK